MPVVFVSVGDPVGSGYVLSLARPGGNATGFTQFEFGIGAKWVELLREISPRATRAAILSDPTAPAAFGMLGAIQSVAPSLGIDISPIVIRDAAEIEHRIVAFAGGAKNGVIVLPGLQTTLHRELIITLVARHKLPAIYPYRYYVTSGGLICYGPDELEHYRQSAGYVDRILKGEKPADMPVQTPTKYELVINLKTAKALGLEVPPSVLARADEVIHRMNPKHPPGPPKRSAIGASKM
jgi:putative ABC transport system substrate-binding protein